MTDNNGYNNDNTALNQLFDMMVDFRKHVDVTFSRIETDLSILKKDVADLKTKDNSNNKRPSSDSGSSKASRTFVFPNSDDEQDDNNFDVDAIIGNKVVKSPGNRKARQSVSVNNLQRSNEVSVLAEYRAEVPDSSHIKLKVLSVENVIKFFNDIVSYQSLYGIKFQAPVARIDNEILQQIHSRWDAFSYEALAKLTHEDLRKVLQKLVQPGSLIQFYRQLDKSVQWQAPSTLHPSPLRYNMFYHALLSLRRDFIDMYEFLSESISDNNFIPACDNKEYGLIKLFVNKIPHEYGKNIMFAITRIKPKFDNIDEFFKEFFKIIEEHRETSMRNKNFQIFFSSSEYMKIEKLRFASVRVKRTGLDNSIHNIDSVIYDSDEDFVNSNAADGYDVYKEQAIEETVNPMSDSEHSTDNEEPPSNTVKVCIAAVVNGSCKKDNCPYEHSPVLLYNERRKWLRLMAEQQANSSTSDNGNGDGSNYSDSHNRSVIRLPTAGVNKISPYSGEYSKESWEYRMKSRYK